MKSNVAKKVFGIIGNVIVWIVAIFALFSVFVTLGAKKSDDGAATIFGHQLRFVETGSMEKNDATDVSGYKIKSIRTRSCVFVETVPEDAAKKAEWYDGLEVGDVLTFKYYYSTQVTITHRIVGIEQKESGGYLITLRGDNVSSDDPSATGTQTIDTSEDGSSYNYVIGKVTGQSYLLGLAVYALKSPIGIILIVIVPCLIVIAVQVVRIAGVLGEDKANKRKAEVEKRDSEIEELKRKIEQLQSNSVGSGKSDDEK